MELEIKKLDMPRATEGGVHYTHYLAPQPDWTDEVKGAIRRVLENLCGEGNIVTLRIDGIRTILFAERSSDGNQLIKKDFSKLSDAEKEQLDLDIETITRRAKKHPELTAEALYNRVSDFSARVEGGLGVVRPGNGPVPGDELGRPRF